jgi:hypothetical protein
MDDEDTLYLVYNLYFLGDPTRRSLVLPVPPMMDADVYQAMLEAHEGALLRTFVQEAGVRTSFYLDVWFPDGEPEVMTAAECRARFPGAARNRARADDGHDTTT